MFGVCLYMQISSQKNSPHFSSTPIHRVNLINAIDGSFIPAVFSKLNPRDDMDRAAIEEIRKTWKGVSFSLMNSFTDGFTKDVQKTEQYNAIELIGEDKLSKKIVGITKYFHDKNPCALSSENKKLYLNVLITNPEASHGAPNRKVKNVGEVLFGEIVKYAKKLNRIV